MHTCTNVYLHLFKVIYVCMSLQQHIEATKASMFSQKLCSESAGLPFELKNVLVILPSNLKLCFTSQEEESDCSLEKVY